MNHYLTSAHQRIVIAVTLVTALLLGLVGTAPPARAASGGSIVFIKDHNVWVMPGDDPAAARAVTRDGTAARPYTAPTQDDGGTIFAVTSLGSGVAGSGDIVRMNADGDRIGQPFRPVQTGLIYDLDVAPDGQLLSYTWFQSSSTPIDGGAIIGSASLFGFTRADGSGSSGLPDDLGGQEASWYDADKVVLSPEPFTFEISGLSTYELGAAEPSKWTDTCRHSGNILDPFPDGCDITSSPQITRRMDRLVTTGNDLNGGADTLGVPVRLLVYELSGPPPAAPVKACEHLRQDDRGSLRNPSWSPDGDALVWALGRGGTFEPGPPPDAGLHVATGFTSGDCAAAFSSADLVVPGGSQPHWSAAPFGAPSSEGPGGFSDTASSVHAGAIAAVAAAGITTGFPDGTFRPGHAVTRGQMASFLARALDLPAAASNPFADTTSSVHRDAIAAVAQAGITTGFHDGTFRPGHAVTRGQMASFLARALDL